MLQTFFVVLVKGLNLFSTEDNKSVPTSDMIDLEKLENLNVEPAKKSLVDNKVMSKNASDLSIKASKTNDGISIKMEKQTFNEDFHVIKCIGTENLEKTISAVNKSTNENVIVKVLSRYSGDVSPDEIEWLKAFKHPNIIEYLQTYVESDYTQIIMKNDRAVVLRLDDYMNKLECFDEKIVNFISHQLTNALFYLHEEMSVAHLNLKLESIIIDDNVNVKLINFDKCREAVYPIKCEEREHASTVSNYACPEIFSKQPYYGKDADIWAFGIIIYKMLNGNFPFKIFDNLLQLPNDMLYPPIDMKISEDVKMLLNGMLERDAEIRITVQQMQYQKWFENVQNITLTETHYAPFYGS